MKTDFSALPEIHVGEHPKVLFVGNGINLSFPGAQNTDTIIKKEWKKQYGLELPDRNDTDVHHEIWKLPFTLQVVAATKDHVQGCMNE